MNFYALTVQQPYASLLIEGIKHYETRTWKVPSRLIGETIAIHAAKSGKLVKVVGDSCFVRHDSGITAETLDKLMQFTLSSPKIFLPAGQVLGLVKVVDCLEITTELLAQISPEEKAIGYWKLGNYAWQLQVLEDFNGDDELVLFDTHAKGKQGLWKWSTDNQQ
jgi:hypothetical protein